MLISAVQQEPLRCVSVIIVSFLFLAGCDSSEDISDKGSNRNPSSANGPDMIPVSTGGHRCACNYQ